MHLHVGMLERKRKVAGSWDTDMQEIRSDDRVGVCSVDVEIEGGGFGECLSQALKGHLWLHNWDGTWVSES